MSLRSSALPAPTVTSLSLCRSSPCRRHSPPPPVRSLAALAASTVAFLTSVLLCPAPAINRPAAMAPPSTASRAMILPSRS
ncbi:hypothetical protein DFH06DRAFT_1340930 [Mycena polygramma]|nr:hypothetical protein DFH06DRAFT_1340930 [Mycena polygramma]